MAAIDGIAAAVASVAGVTLLDVDPGRATNRTVVTFVGPPQAVIEAAVRAGKASVDFIDMARHQGEHPRFGAMDVCPLVPVSGITMAEAADHARELGRRLGDEAGLTVYLYEHAASAPHRRNLAAVRAGEYEGLPTKLRDPAWQPDFGPATFNSRSGATAVGARDFLIAYNINLNTTSVRRANAIAFDVREKGRLKRSGDPLTGEVVRGPDGEPEWVPGTLKTVKAIGKKWSFIASMTLVALTAIPFYWMKPDQTAAIYACQIIGMMFSGVNATLFWALVADTADFQEWQFQTRTTGVVFSRHGSMSSKRAYTAEKSPA